MPYDEVMHKFKKGKLHSGSKKGPIVENRDQAIAIEISEKEKADEGKTEYKSEKEKTKKKKSKSETHDGEGKHHKISMA